MPLKLDGEGCVMIKMKENILAIAVSTFMKLAHFQIHSEHSNLCYFIYCAGREMVT